MGPEAATAGTSIRTSSAPDFWTLLVAQAWPGPADCRIARSDHHDGRLRRPAVGTGDRTWRDQHPYRRAEQRDVDLLPRAPLAAGRSGIGGSNGTPGPSLRVDLVVARNGRHAD